MKYFEILKSVLILVLLSVSASWGQSTDNEANIQTIEKAKEIIEQAQKAISPKNTIKDLKGADISYETKIQRVNSEKMTFDESSEIRVAFEFPEKMFYEVYSDFTSNQQVFTQIMNSSHYSEATEMLVDGKPFNFQSNLESLKPKRTEEEQIRGFKGRMLKSIFPTFFRSDMCGEIIIYFVGEAEVNGVKANIIEAKEGGKAIFQLFIDKEKGLPILMIETFLNFLTKKEVERKTYYSDYKEVEGFKVPSKINISQGQGYSEERKLKKLRINPTFKSNFFELKEK